MIAGPNVPLPTMVKAVAYTIAVLDAAGVLDIDASEAERAFFQTRHKVLEPLLAGLLETERAIGEHDLGEGLRLQTRVEVGDMVLDRGLERANTLTKLELKGRSGLGASHVFGDRVGTLTGAKLAEEPRMVLEAVLRFSDLPPFESKARLVDGLTLRAKSQQQCLDEREAGKLKRATLVSHGVKLVNDASSALFALQGALLERYPSQKEYVSSFFLDTRPRRATTTSTDSAETAEASPAETGTTGDPTPPPTAPKAT